MISAVRISFTQTAALVHAEKHFPLKTPLRWRLIAEYVAKCVPALDSRQNASNEGMPSMVIGNPCSSSEVTFQATSEMCKTSFAILSSCHPDILQYSKCQAEVAFSDPSMSAFKPIVLLPPVLRCCDKPVYLK